MADLDMLQRLLTQTTEGMPLEELMKLGILEPQFDIQQRQQAMAHALRQPQENPWAYTPGGALGGGIGNLLNNVAGQVGERRAQGEQQDILEKMVSGRTKFAKQFAQANLMRQGTPFAQSLAYDPMQSLGPIAQYSGE